MGIGLESTIIDLTVSPPQILRPGYITREKLGAVLGTVDTDVTILRADSGQAPKAPGMKYRHYAPRGELTIVEGTPEQVIQVPLIAQWYGADVEVSQHPGGNTPQVFLSV